TTTLRAIAGFVAPSQGRILIDGEDVTVLPPNRSTTGAVFQSSASLSHMTVEEHVAFGLRMRHVARLERKRRATDALHMVGLSKLGTRYPAQLSGGQQQRVALA